MTPSQPVPERPKDVIAHWLEELSKGSFNLCFREAKIFDGLHQNIKMVSGFSSSFIGTKDFTIVLL